MKRGVANYALAISAIAVFLVLFFFFTNVREHKIAGNQVAENYCSSSDDCNPGFSCINSLCTSQEDPSQQEIQTSQSEVLAIAGYAERAGELAGEIARSPDNPKNPDYRRSLRDTYTDARRIYDESTLRLREYGRSSSLEEDYRQISVYFDDIRSIIIDVDVLLVSKTQRDFEHRMREAAWQIDYDKGREADFAGINDFYDGGVVPPTPSAPSDIAPSDPASGGTDGYTNPPLPLNPCDYAVGAAAFDVVNPGVGIDYTSGSLCNFDPAPLLPAAGLDVDESPPGSGGFYVEDKDSSGVSDYNKLREAVVLGFDRNGVLQVSFFLSPTYESLDEKINDFINNLLYTEGEIPADGIDESLAQDIIAQSRVTPWVLWLVLGALIMILVIFRKLLLLDHEILIVEGRKAISKKNFIKAVKVYNDLASHYNISEGESVKQEILEYLSLLRKSMQKVGIESSVSKGTLPHLIVKSLGVFSATHSQSVERMIRDAMRESEKDKKFGKIRLPVITDAYKNLETKEKERLAPLYEKLVYNLRS